MTQEFRTLGTSSCAQVNRPSLFLIVDTHVQDHSDNYTVCENNSRMEFSYLRRCFNWMVVKMHAAAPIDAATAAIIAAPTDVKVVGT